MGIQRRARFHTVEFDSDSGDRIKARCQVRTVADFDRIIGEVQSGTADNDVVGELIDRLWVNDDEAERGDFADALFVDELAQITAELLAFLGRHTRPLTT